MVVHRRRCGKHGSLLLRSLYHRCNHIKEVWKYKPQYLLLHSCNPCPPPACWCACSYMICSRSSTLTPPWAQCLGFPDTQVALLPQHWNHPLVSAWLSLLPATLASSTAFHQLSSSPYQGSQSGEIGACFVMLYRSRSPPLSAARVACVACAQSPRHSCLCS